MTEQPDQIAARIAAVEQRLLVAVVRGDEHTRLVAREEISRLKRQQWAPAPQDGCGRSTRPQPALVAR